MPKRLYRVADLTHVVVRNFDATGKEFDPSKVTLSPELSFEIYQIVKAHEEAKL